MAVHTLTVREELKKLKKEIPQAQKEIDHIIIETNRLEERFLERTNEINLSEIMNRDLLDRRAYEKLKELMEKNATSPGGEWVGLGAVDTYAARLYRSGLVERIRDPRQYKMGFVYRIKSAHLPIVHELIKKYEE